MGSSIEGRDHVAASCEEHAAAIGVADRVRFLGYLPEAELEQVLVATDVALCPFRTMSASGALATWISAGRPIVTSDLAPIRELMALAPGALHPFAPVRGRPAGGSASARPSSWRPTGRIRPSRRWRGAWRRRGSWTATWGSTGAAAGGLEEVLATVVREAGRRRA